MGLSYSIVALVAAFSLNLFLSILSFSFWYVQRKDQTPLWIATWLAASGLFSLCRLLQYVPLVAPLKIIVPRLLLSAAYSMVWWGYGLVANFIGYRPPRWRWLSIILLPALLIILLSTSDLILTSQVVMRTAAWGGRFYGVEVGPFYLPASMLILALGAVPPFHLLRDKGPQQRENRWLALGFILVIVFSLSDFLATSLSLNWPRFSDFSHLPVTVIFSFIQILRFGRLYKDMDLMVHQRTRELSLANETLKTSEARYRLLFDNTPVGMLLVDVNGAILEVNASALQILGSPSAEATQSINMFTFPTLIQAGISQDLQKCFQLGQAVDDEYLYQSKWGKSIHARVRYIPIVNESGRVTLVQMIAEDTTARAQAEKLQQSVYQIARAAIVDQSLDDLYVQIHQILQQLLPTKYFYIAIYDQINDILSFPYFQDAFDVAPPPAKPGRGLTEYVLRTRQPLLVTPGLLDELVRQKEVELVGPDSFQWLGVPLIAHDQAIGVMVVQSYDESVHFNAKDVEVMRYVSTQVANAIDRKQADEALKRYAHQLETLNTINATLGTSLSLEEVLKLILEQIRTVIPVDSATIFLKEERGLRIVMDWNITPSLVGMIFAEDDLLREARDNREPLILDLPVQDQRFQNWGDFREIQTWMGVPLMVRDTLVGFMTLDSNSRDAFSHDQIPLVKSFAAQSAQAMDNARQFGHAQRRLERLASLYEIDQAISSNQDLPTRLEVLLSHILKQLEVDAAVILLYRPQQQTLEFAAGRGFRTQALRYTNLHLGEGFAGRVASERHIIQVPDLAKIETGFLRSPEFRTERFIAYIGVPLIAQGNIIGVLEIYHRQALWPDSEWMSFLSTLAGQAAIAIDNINIFNELQRSNQELVQAYDATIEGWARALELRDMETEGHSRRVVELTLKLAGRLGITGKALEHMRRGALLHDIGKMGVPDLILQKTSQLNAEEWAIMRQHPVYAYQMLRSIPYLEPALDIPYYHHERWDGSGYPLGLSSEEIPLAARVFAVVDVWDAMISDRPYRAALPRKNVVEYLHQQSGKHFDPKIVSVFLHLLSEI